MERSIIPAYESGCTERKRLSSHLFSCADGLAERNTAIVGRQYFMKEYGKAGFLKFRDNTFSKNTVLETSAAQNDAVESRFFPNYFRHPAEGNRQAHVESVRNLTFASPRKNFINDFFDHGEKIVGRYKIR